MVEGDRLPSWVQIFLVNFYDGTVVMFSVPFPVITLFALLFLIVVALFPKKSPQRYPAFSYRLHSPSFCKHAALGIRVSHAQEYSIRPGNTLPSRMA
jgi:hypothetical protein